MLIEETIILLIGWFVIGLIIGSFFNVVIYRLPVMLERAWKQEAREILELEEVSQAEKTFNLIYPCSHCPHCAHTIKWYENIPVVSFLLQKGRCRYCKKSINYQYPFVELLTGIIFALLFYRFGFSELFFGGIVFSSFLIIMAVIDFNTQLLPDILTLLLLWMGIIFNLYFSSYITVEMSILGVIFGYLSLWIVAYFFRIILRKQAMGHGDFKLYAALGAWMGAMALPLLILIAAIIGLLLAVIWRIKKGQAMSFGPALALSGVVSFIFYPEVLMYLHLY